ncbi:MAG: hypothetical protein K2O16_03160 [Lachnospiraceae bacterium]|nr:hypothetical protein [Lachnospiraceae bacterium]
MNRLTKYSNDLIRNKAVNILRKLDSENELDGDKLALISSFCLIERVENKQLKKYEDLEEQGRLLKLPCAVGDTVWYISERIEKQGRKKVEVSFVDEGIVDSITLGCMMVPQINVCNDENVWMTFDGVEDFGKTVFLTKEAAEAALKEMED